jgi:hypothetical protein
MKYLICFICTLVDGFFAWQWFCPKESDGIALAFLPLLAVAFSAGIGMWNQYQQYEAGNDQADLAEQQSKVDAELARREAEEDSNAESDEVRRAREEQRRRRASIESAYASSGVVLEGTAADMLTRQRKKDELNIQKTHRGGNERRKVMLWNADFNQKSGLYQAKSLRRKATTQFISGVTNTAVGSYGNYKKWSK